MRTALNFLLVLLMSLLTAGLPKPAEAQDLEPRRWTHLPVGLNVLGAGLVWSTGDIYLDPVLRIEDASYQLAATGVSYVRAFDFFGTTGRLDVSVPLASGRWEGLVDGVQTSVRRQGLADPWMRFSVNLYGSPALSGEKYLKYRAAHETHTSVGAAIAVIMPLGQYDPDRLINLGNNRWVVRPQIGVLHQRRKWQFELTGSVFLFQTNDEFFQGTVLERDPLWFVQGHAIYSIDPRWWTSLSLGFAHGGRSTIDGQPKGDDSRTSLMALSLGYNINRQQGLKLYYLRSRTNISLGMDTDSLGLSWSILWSR